MRKLCLLLPLLAFFGFKALAAETPVLKIEGGQIQGVTCDNPDVYVYKGIPFKAGLYALYVIIAIAGYRKWRSVAKEVKSEK